MNFVFVHSCFVCLVVWVLLLSGLPVKIDPGISFVSLLFLLLFSLLVRIDPLVFVFLPSGLLVRIDLEAEIIFSVALPVRIVLGALLFFGLPVRIDHG